MKASPSHLRLWRLAAIGLFFVLIILSLLWWRNRSQAGTISDPEVYATWIDAYSGRLLRKQEPLRIRFKEPISPSLLADTVATQKLIKVHPAVTGQAYWEDEQTLVFAAKSPWQIDQNYHVEVAIQRLFTIDEPSVPFVFAFSVLQPSFQVQYARLRPANGTSYQQMELQGEVLFADREDSTKIKQLLEVRWEKQALPVQWSFPDDLSSAQFKVSGIYRPEQSRQLQLYWNGKPIGAQKTLEQTLKVPARDEFVFLGHEVFQAPDQHLKLYFSDPLKPGQMLDGLIGIEEVLYPSFAIEEHAVAVYAGEILEGNRFVQISEGILNGQQKALQESLRLEVLFENPKPAVKIPGKGTILPNPQALRFPFEAIYLKKVDVTIIEIPAQNVPQYMQTSGEGSYELRRVGRPVVQKTIALDNDPQVDLTKNNRFSLDLQDLLKASPGSIYRVLIGFRKEYTLYPCDNLMEDEASDEEAYYYRHEEFDEDTDFWSRYNSFYPSGYQWEQRDNPCHISYYTSDRWVSRDIMASSIGLIAKWGTQKEMHVYANDINTTTPLAGVEIEALDYQQQRVGVAKTDGEGHAVLQLSRKPYMLRALKGKEKSYLKVDDGSALLMSRFDVGGTPIQKGMKGFIYGERGVWRPGDTVFLTFIYAPQLQALPERHPVTLEWINPKGQIVQKIVEHQHLGGFYSFKLPTDPDALTGVWQAKIQAGGAIFQKSIKIETILPNRFKLQLQVGQEDILTAGRSQEMSLRADWLFGAPAAQMKAKVEATLLPVKTHFEKFAAYVFDDPTKNYPTQQLTLYEGKTNAEGLAQWTWSIPANKEVPGMLSARLTSRVFEPGGAFSIHQEQVKISPYKRYVGIKMPKGDAISGMLPTDQDHQIEIVLVGENGQILDQTTELRVELYKMKWRWWWSQEEEFSGNFSQDRYNQKLKSEEIEVRKGKAIWNLRINEPDWGRFLVRVIDEENGHSSAVTAYLDWPGWAGRAQDTHSAEAAMLAFTAQKSKVQVGEEIVLTIPSSEGGRGLVSLENGSGVLESWWVETKAKQTVVRFKATENMTPTVFAHVTLLQPHAQTANDLPIRMYGVLPLEINNPATSLAPLIQVNKEWKPSSQVQVGVSEEQGKPMYYTLAIVDEGLLDLTRFETPQPHKSFYAKEALGVRTWDLYDHIIGAWSGDLERILGIGGDAEGNALVHPAKANRFPPVVRYLGPFYLKKGQKAQHKVDLPAYVGSLRVMVVAGYEGAYGSADKTVAVKQPLMVLGTAPRQIAPGESFQLPITVFGLGASIRQAEVSIQTSRHFKTSSRVNQVHFVKPGEQMLYPTLTALQDTGVGSIQIQVKSGAHTAKYQLELDVQNPNPLTFQVQSFQVGSGQTFDQHFQVTKGSHARLEISSLPAIRLDQRLSYLIQYPHGCLEQVTSALFPQLYVGRLQTLSKAEAATVHHHLQSGIKRLHAYQLANGGFSYWPGQLQADEWATNYVGHFLLEAERLGYVLPPQMKEKWMRFQKEKARQWTARQATWQGAEIIQAYRLFGLALGKSGDLGAMNRLRSMSDLGSEALWRLAAAYQIMGQEVIAQQLIRQNNKQKLTYSSVNPTYGSQLRDLSMRLETYVLLGEQQEATSLLRQVAASLGQDQWMSTQTTAYALLAIGKFMDTFKTSLHVTYALNGQTTQVEGLEYLHALTLTDQQSSYHLRWQNKGKQNLEIRKISKEKRPMEVHAAQAASSGAVRMQLRYLNANGQAIDPTRLMQGTDFIAELRVTNTGQMGDLRHLALSQVMPSGWEILNTRFLGTEIAEPAAQVDYEDIRDDRVLRYFTLRSGQTKVFKVRLHAAYQGRFYLPSSWLEDMYDGRNTVSSESKWIEVYAPQEEVANFVYANIQKPFANDANRNLE
jgi:uncharacterized protein YfaS (alpha-2-macroglobulin family)